MNLSRISKPDFLPSSFSVLQPIQKAWRKSHCVLWIHEYEFEGWAVDQPASPGGSQAANLRFYIGLPSAAFAPFQINSEYQPRGG
ncbi:hypothetical protein [Methylobacterium sp.]|uniref:hypothetical protein n=1 Tax=Methylobacterium sp. TaxID=409 RepID=UPI0025FAA7CB|nr:hypothetical protein [Methylobacterium sp.]MBY0256996.1 hypothetical protein [Methylobacterium sp.]